MIEKIVQPCIYCGLPITVEWDNGVILPFAISLLGDWLAHDDCFAVVWEGNELFFWGS
jgi:hypothetical protein